MIGGPASAGILVMNNNISKCKNISISSFCLKTRNGNIVQIFGYDEIADFLYSHLAINDDVYVEGYLTSFKNNISVNIININKIM